MDSKFYFGASTSSHQVEGNNHNDWSEWEKKNAPRLASLAQGKSELIESFPGAGNPENYISGNACNSYELFNKDIGALASLGCNAYRFSIEWSRIEPEEGKFNSSAILKYREMILAAKGAGLEPFLTLHHFTNPTWIERDGGIISKNFPKFFERFVEKVGIEFKNQIRFITPINEPEILSLNGYYRGTWPPSKKSFFKFFKARKNLVQAHILAYKKLKEINPEFVVGPVCNLTYFESAGGLVNYFIKSVALRFWNFNFLDKVRKYSDFIGINYYFHNRINWGLNKNGSTSSPQAKVSDMGWELYPQGIENILTETYSRYRLPLFITENGLADASDKNRTWFIKETFQAISRALKNNVDLRGYFHWSLLDNFEWDKGFWPKFGLFKVNFNTFERIPRESSKVYAEEIKKFINE